VGLGFRILRRTGGVERSAISGQQISSQQSAISGQATPFTATDAKGAKKKTWFFCFYISAPLFCFFISAPFYSHISTLFLFSYFCSLFCSRISAPFLFSVAAFASFAPVAVRFSADG
jgi:hypothetical protein